MLQINCKNVFLAFALLFIGTVRAQTTMVYEPVKPEHIKGKASSALKEFPVEASFNGSGFSKEWHKSDNLGRSMWISTVSTDKQQALPNTKSGVVWLLYEFDDAKDIDRISIWNHNQDNHLNRGLQKVYIQHSLDGIHWETFQNGANDFFIIPKSKGSHLSPYDFKLDFPKTKFKYLCITADLLKGNYYHDGNPQTVEEAELNEQNINYYGLSEIRFYQKEQKKVSLLPRLSKVSYEVTQGYRKSPEGPRREFILKLEEPLYQGGTVTISYKGKKETVSIPASPEGIYGYTLQFPPGMMEAKEKVNFAFASPQGNFKQEMDVSAARTWTVYFLPHSHLDIGYTNSHEEVQKRQLRNIDIALDLIKQTESHPKESQFKWNIETVWPLLAFKDRYYGTPKWEEFKKAVQSGSMGINASLGNILTGLSKQEELTHLFDDGIKIGKDLGIPVKTVMMSDVPGFSWGLVTAMAENEIKYFSMAPNYVPFLYTGGSRVGLSHVEWANKPFYWQSQSGKEEVLCWSAGTGYSFFHDWLSGTLSSSGLLPIWKELEKLEGENFPYPMTYFRYTVNGDNGPPDRAMSDLIQKWNETYTSPKFEIATTQELFTDFEKQYGAYLPRYKGDFTPYWEDGAASTAAVLALNRKNSEKLNKLEILWSMKSPADFPSELFDVAWRNVVLFSEHTWGASASGPQPDAPMTKLLWKQKQHFALVADSLAKKIQTEFNNKSIGKSKPQYVQVYNASLHNRSDVVQLQSDLDLSKVILRDNAGVTIPLQSNGKNNWIFIAQDVPPLATKIYTIEKLRDELKPSGIQVTPAGLQNEKIKMTIDAHTGTITELITPDGKNYAGEGGLNKYIYSERNLKNLWSDDAVISIKTVNEGPVSTTVQVYSKPKGTSGLTRDITLYKGLNRVDIQNTIDKTESIGYENIRFAFPFAIKNPETAIDLPFSEIHPEREQLAGANKNFFSMNNGVAITGLEYSVLLANVDNPILEVGSLSGEAWMDDSVKFLDWKRQSSSSSTVYSWVMNNSWGTNYKKSQPGKVTFNYSIIPLKGNATDSKMKSLEIARPLTAIISDSKKEETSLFSLTGNHQISVSTIRPAKDGSGYIVRLANTTNKSVNTAFIWGSIAPKKVVECTNQETTIKEFNPESFWMLPYGTITLKIEK